MKSFDETAGQYSKMIYSIIHSLRIYKNIDHYYCIGLEALWEAEKKYMPETSSFTTFAYSVIKGRIRNQLRQDARWDIRNHITDAIEHSNTQTYSEEYFPYEFITICAPHLTEKQLCWLVGTYVHQFSISDIAQQENVAPSAVKSWRRSALEKLRKELQKNKKEAPFAALARRPQ